MVSNNPLQNNDLQHWRLKIFSTVFIGYVGYVYTRKSLTYAVPNLLKELNYEKTELGILASSFALSYALSKALGGISSDYLSSTKLFGFGLLLAGLTNILFGFSSTIYLFTLFWGLNGLCQGVGWPPVAKLMTEWISQKDRATWWSIISASQSIGGALIAVTGSFVSEYYGWRTAMTLHGCLAVIVSLFVFLNVRDSPSSIGLQPVEAPSSPPPKKPSRKHIPTFASPAAKMYPSQYNSGSDKNPMTTRQIIMEYTLKNKSIWLLSLVSFLHYLVRAGVTEWTVLLLVDTKGFTPLSAGAALLWFEVGGTIGGFIAGILSDRVFSGNRGQVNVIFMLGMSIAVTILWYTRITNYAFNSFVIFLIGFFLYGPQNLLGLMATELVHRRATGTTLGMLGAFSGIGASIAGYPLSVITQHYGWDYYGILLTSASLLATILLLPLMTLKNTKKD